MKNRQEISRKSFAKKKSIHDLEKNDCRWPLGDPQDDAFAFCAAKISKGQYCEDHAKIAYVKFKKYKGEINV